MRFWLTLILGTMLLSAGLTALTLYQGGQILDPQMLTPPPSPNAKPELAFELAPGQEQIANGIEMLLPPAKSGSTHKVTVKCRNVSQGDTKGDVTLRLVRVQPGPTKGRYVTPGLQVLYNGQPMGPDTMTIRPGESAEITMLWQVEGVHVAEQKPEGYHYRAEFDWNDHRFDDPLLIEAIMRVEKR